MLFNRTHNIEDVNVNMKDQDVILAGWGLGLERLLTIILGIDNVREVILYPRDPERLKP
jgi:aspartyl/asparaginyl-tRNA synthetase